MRRWFLVPLAALAALVPVVGAQEAPQPPLGRAAESTASLAGLAEKTRPALRLEAIGRYTTGIFDESAAEIAGYDVVSQRVFFTNSNDSTLDILDLSTPANPTLVGQIDLTPFGAGPNSVAVANGIVAVAVEADLVTDPGQVVFFDANGNVQGRVTVGALPDMVTFTPDGSTVLVANEGEPDDGIDPPGSISVIDLSAGIAGATVATADFTGFDGREAELRNRGVRLFPDATTSLDVEPEYIAVDPDGVTAFATLQEANAFAVVDIASATVVDILPLGTKDHSRGPLNTINLRFPDLPVLGTTATTNPANPAENTPGQDILLGGLSGLWFDGIDVFSGNYRFLTVPDRGPNGEPTDVDGDGENERPFALPDYQAQVVPFEVHPTNGAITLGDPILLWRADGTTPITGLPNIPGIDEEPVDLFGNALPYDAFGADMEGVVRDPNGDFWMVDEYRPAIYHFDGTGRLIDRLVPAGTGALGGMPAGTYGTETLPAEYSNRRRNRGFEAMALDAENGILYAFIQTPLANPDRAASDGSDVIRILGVDVTTGQPVREHVYLLEGVDFRTAKVDKIGDAVWAGNGTMFVIERDSSTDANGKKPIFEIDLRNATNLLGPGAPALIDGKTLEQHTADELAGLGITPVFKRKVTNLPSAGYRAGDKPEGLALLPAGWLAVLNDNDFGLLDAALPVDGTVPLNPNPAPVVLGVLIPRQGNTLDASDRDGTIRMQNWAVEGLYMPDAIDAFRFGNRHFFVTANEGDARDEDDRVGDLVLDPEAFPQADLQDNENLGRLEVSTLDGDLDGDGDYDRLYSYGARSFTLWDEFGNLVWDSSDLLAKIVAIESPGEFNSTNDENGSFDARSDAKGIEPEAVELAWFRGRRYAFVGLERVGGIAVFDVQNPRAPFFVDYVNSRDFTGDAEAGTAGDLGPESILYIKRDRVRGTAPLLVVANEVSGSVTVFRVIYQPPV